MALDAELKRLSDKVRYRRKRNKRIMPRPESEILMEILDDCRVGMSIHPEKYCSECAAIYDTQSELCPSCLKIRKAEYLREYRASPEYKVRRNEQLRFRIRADERFRLVKRIRGRISSFIKAKGFVKIKSTKEMLGCSYDDLKNYIEKQFKPGMSWANMGEWHIDHKIPLVSAISDQDLIMLNHYTNLRPMWAIDNLKKGRKYNGVTY